MYKRKVTEDGIPYSFKDRYDLTSHKTYGTCTLKDGQQFKFDLSDFDKIKTHLWRFTRGRVIAYGAEAQHKMIDLSHVILDEEKDSFKNKDKKIIFKNKNPLDYRRNNLVFATSSQVSQHQKKSIRNTSGITGVSWAKREEKWRAYINIKEQGRVELGWYNTFEEAVIARLTAEIKMYGSFSPQMDLAVEKGVITQKQKEYLLALIRSTNKITRKRTRTEYYDELRKRTENRKQRMNNAKYPKGYVGHSEKRMEYMLDNLCGVREIVSSYVEKYGNW